MLVRGEKTKIITLERLLFMAFQRNTITSLSPLQPGGAGKAGRKSRRER
ncbi:hypothetical protein BDE02_07G014000 [Populus trichocarpa]|nr:hypothetical protein BDE02_07G014000 [Populus trichocarpa]